MTIPLLAPPTARARATCRVCAAWAALLGFTLLGGACASSSGAKASPGATSSEQTPPASSPPARTTAERLYDAILAETRARGWAVETASPKYYLVNTEYELLNPRFRKRRTMRVMVFPRGGALRVKIVHERDVGQAGAEQWVVVDDPITSAREEREELDLARAIERRFHDSPRHAFAVDASDEADSP